MATRRRAARANAARLPRDADDVTVRLGDRDVALTNLRKPFWPELALTKGDLLQYYLDVAPVLLPHVEGRPMVMKRYPNGAHGDFFFMKRAPSPRPAWVRTCPIEHDEGLVDYPVVDDVATLLWLVNLGCIDLNPWYARADDVGRPDWLHFDLDPTPGATFAQVRETALVVRDALAQLGMAPLAKTTGSKGLHVYVAIRRGPLQQEVWGFAKAVAFALAQARPDLITAEYQVAKRPKAHVLVDYNQDAGGRTLASVYSVRPRAQAPVSAPVTWEEVERGVAIEDFTLRNVLARIARLGDLWAPLLATRGRFDLARLLGAKPARGNRARR